MKRSVEVYQLAADLAERRVIEEIPEPMLRKVSDVKQIFGKAARVIEHKIAPVPRRDGNGNPHQNPKPQASPSFVTMDMISPETVDWLWLNRIPIGRLTLIDGDPGAGKSFLTLKIAAMLSRGETLPGGKKLSTKYALLISVEDGFGDTVRPRLDAMGADVSKIIVPNPERGLMPSLVNPGFIEAIVKETGPALVILDPLIAFSGRTDADKASQVRELLSPLMSLAQRYSFACVIVRHLNKQGGLKAMYRGNGSIDFMAACRSAFIVAEDPEENGRRIFAHVKNSLGPKTPSLSFYIDADGFRWGDVVDRDADSLLQDAQQNRGRESKQLEAAKRFIQETLTSGPMESRLILEKGAAAGISRGTLWRAKKAMHGVKAVKKSGSLDGEWFWRLEDTHEDADETFSHAREHD